MILEQGRPTDCTGRAEREIRTYDLLDRLGIAYGRIDHDAADTMEICREIDESLDATICKNLFLCNRQGTAFYLLMMPGDKPFKTKELSGQLGTARLSFASGEDMEALLGVCPGSVTVLGLINDKENRVRLLIDEDLLAAPEFGCHPLVNTSSLAFSTADLTEKVIPATNHTPTKVTLIGE
jgi:Ala-tRNA(Pro) deacylase